MEYIYTKNSIECIVKCYVLAIIMYIYREYLMKCSINNMPHFKNIVVGKKSIIDEDLKATSSIPSETLHLRLPLQYPCPTLV